MVKLYVWRVDIERERSSMEGFQNQWLLDSRPRPGPRPRKEGQERGIFWGSVNSRIAAARSGEAGLSQLETSGGIITSFQRRVVPFPFSDQIPKRIIFKHFTKSIEGDIPRSQTLY